MSVIIRLQNLPWSANALEIRTFFRGLNIPDGGVHIVGGEMGDAFIAFSSDEDARQAMLLDRGKINEVQVRLLLSSRSEMQKVIEQARQQSLTLQKKILSGKINAKTIVKPSATVSKHEPDPRLRSRNDDDKRRRSNRDRSQDRYRSSRSSSGERDYRDRRRRDRSRSDSRDRSRRDRHRSSNSRGKSREATADKAKTAESNQSQSSVWDLINKKPQLTNPYTNAYSTQAPKSNEIDLTASPPRESESIPGLDGIIGQDAINNLKNLLNSNQNITSAGLLSALSCLTKPESPALATPPKAPSPPVIKSLAPIVDIPSGHFYPPINDVSSKSQNQQQDKSKDVDNDDRAETKYTDDDIQDKRCVRISHMNPKTTYSEVRRFFSGLFIQNNGIKLINDDKGDRLGTAYVKFLRSTSTSKAMFRDGTSLNGWKVKVDVVSETEFDVAIDSFRPPNKWHDKPREDENNGHTKHTEDVNTDVTVLKLLDLPAYTNELDIKKVFGPNRHLEIRLDREKTSNRQYGFVKFENSLELKRALLSNSSPRIGNHKIEVRKSSEEEMEALCKAMDTDVLVLSDLPAHSAEQDVMKLFSSFSIIDIFMTRTKPEGKKEYEYFSYIKLSNPADARKILSNRTYTLQHRIIQVRVSNTKEMEKAREAHLRKLAAEEAEQKKKEENLKKNLIREDQTYAPEKIVQQIKFNSIPNEGVSARNIPTPLVTDPRLRNGDGPTKRKSRFAEAEPNHPEPAPPAPPQYPSLFIGLSNIAYRATVMDIGTYFMENRCSPNKIEIIKGPKGLPCGDVVLEMKSMEDIHRALTLNQTNFYNRKITVVPITINDVINRLGENFLRECESMRSPSFQNQQQYHPNQQQPYFPDDFDRRDMDSMTMDPRGMDSRPMGPRGMDSMPMDPRGNDPRSMDPRGNDPRSMNQRGMDSRPMDPRDVRSGDPRLADLRDLRYDDPRGGMPRLPDIRDLDSINFDNNFNDNGYNQDNRRERRQNPFADPLNDDSMMVEPVQDDVPNQPQSSAVPDKFNDPGKVLILQNVPYSATIEDIARFFGNFDVLPEDVIRRYNKDGSPTGDARVAFHEQYLAEAAYEQKNRQKLFNRILYLSPV